jgi:hypothetical protein
MEEIKYKVSQPHDFYWFNRACHEKIYSKSRFHSFKGKKRLLSEHLKNEE